VPTAAMYSVRTVSCADCSYVQCQDGQLCRLQLCTVSGRSAVPTAAMYSVRMVSCADCQDGQLACYLVTAIPLCNNVKPRQILGGICQLWPFYWASVYHQ